MRIRYWFVIGAVIAAEFAHATGKINFIENKGQWSRDIEFSAHVGSAGMFFQTGQFRFAFLDQRQLQDRHHGVAPYRESSENTPFVNGYMLTSSFIGFNSQTHATPFGQKIQYYNFFLGDDQSKWRSSVHAYDGILYSSFYEGIDLKVYSEGTNFKYDFIVEAGSDPSRIQWRYAGASSISIVDGDLVVRTPLTDVIEGNPVAYQLIEGRKVFVKAKYKVNGELLSFDLAEYDHCYPLVIDPVLIFSTYSGSTADNWGSTATPGENGKLYSSGITNWNNGGTFPATAGAFQTTYGGIYDVALLKYDSAGHQLLYASYLGGGYSESPHSLVVDKDQNLLVLGTTSSTNFPTTNGAFSRHFSGGYEIDQFFGPEIPIPYEIGSDIFVAKISSDGTTLLGSTYLGGTNNDGLNSSNSPLVHNYGDQMRGDIATDANGNIIVSTVTASSDFPVRNAFDLSFNGGESDALILELSGDLTQLKWATFLGGNLADASHTIRIDKSGNLFVGGGSASPNFPTTSGVYQTSLAGDADGWIAQISGDGTSLLKSTLTGTSNFNEVYFLDLDQSENVYVYGQTVGSFPVTSGTYSNANSGQFIQKFDNALTTLQMSTVFGSGIGIPNISPTAFLVNDCNNIFLSGWGGAANALLGYWNSTTYNMPVTSGALQKNTSGSDFYFMVLSPNASQLLYATYLGGSSSRTHIDGGTCRFDKKGIVYHVVCSGCQFDNAQGHSTSDFPTTTTAWSRTNNSDNCNNAAFKFDLSTLKARIQANTTDFKHPGISTICTNEKFVLQNLSIGGQEFDWNLGNGTKEVKTDTTLVPYSYAVPGQYKVKLTAIDPGTCASVDSTSTILNVYTPVGSAGVNQTICFGTSATLVAKDGTSYQWASTDKSFTASIQPNVTVSPTDTTQYFVTITDLHGCVSKDTLTVKVVPNMDLEFKVSEIFGCVGRPTVNLTNGSPAGEDVSFDFGDGNTSTENQASHTYAVDGTYNVQIVGKKSFCTYTKSVTVPVYYRFVPNVITPESTPGLNDTFMVQYGEQRPVPGAALPVKVSLKVYNRWGKVVYENDDYRNDWGAKNVDGGTYYFDVTLQGECACKSWMVIEK